MLAACQAAGQPRNAGMFGPGETISGMSLTTGSEDAPSLRAFCSPAQVGGNVAIFECHVPALPRLAVGQVLLLTGDSLAGLDRAGATWEFYIDDQAVDLERFGTYDIVLPAMPASPSPLREVFTRSPVWDVVLTNLIPGEYTLRARAHSGSQSYNWVVNLSVETADVGAGIRWTGIQKVS